MINIEALLTQSTASIASQMGIDTGELPPPEALRYFRFQEIPFILFYIANKTHRNSMRQIRERYEIATGQEISYETVRGVVRRYYDEMERVKMMEGKAKQN